MSSSIRVLKSQGGFSKIGDQIVEGDLIVNSGITTQALNQVSEQVGGSGAVFTAFNIIRQVIDYAGLSSGQTTIIHTPFTSGPAALIGSGDYLVALTQPAESGATIVGIAAASAGTISVKYQNDTNVDPAAAEFRFLVIRSTVLSN